MVETKIVKCSPEKIDRSAIELGAEILKRGGLVVFPTETVYGLGALISKREAIRRIFEVKGRPMDNPLIVHVLGTQMFLDLVEDPPDKVLKLTEKFWPGPLTIVWWKKPVVPDEVTAGLPKVAVRSPAHPVALKLIEACGEAIAAPSANRSGKPSPTTAEHVVKDLYGLVDLIIDSGETLHGVESTIIDFTSRPPKLLRPGALPVEVVEEFLGEKILVTETARGFIESDVAEAPGMKYRHYAPESQLVVVETRDYSKELKRLVDKVRELVLENRDSYRRLAVICSSETCREYRDLGVVVLDIGSRENLFVVARNLFKVLRKLDELRIEYAVVEGFEEKGLGLAVMNRLRKASGHRVVIV